MVKWGGTGRRAAHPARREAQVPFPVLDKPTQGPAVGVSRAQQTCFKSGKPLPKCWKASLTILLKDITACKSSASTNETINFLWRPVSIGDPFSAPHGFPVKCASRISDFFSAASDVSVAPDLLSHDSSPFLPW